MAKNDNLTDFLTDVANAIREKKGTNEPINPQDFSSEIASIQTGGGVDKLQWRCDNVKSLANEFNGYTGTDYSILDGVDTSKVKSFSRMFFGNTNMTTLPELDYSGLQNKYNDMDYMCSGGCKYLKNAVITLKVPTNMSSVFDCQSYTVFTNLTLTINNTNYITSLNNCFNYSRIDAINETNTLDLINCLNLYNAFNHCSFYGNNKTLTLLNTQNVQQWGNAFNYSNIENISELDFAGALSSNYHSGVFYYCNHLKEIHVKNTSNIKNFPQSFQGCSVAKTIETVDMLNMTNITSLFTGCAKLENLTLKNIKVNLQIGSGTKWGHLLTNESLLNTAQELWDNTNNALGGTRTLTMSTTSKTAIQGIYVKLITPTAEQEAEDPYINNKKPCVECTSTDEGAMTLEEYIISKNWSIA